MIAQILSYRNVMWCNISNCEHMRNEMVIIGCDFNLKAFKILVLNIISFKELLKSWRINIVLCRRFMTKIHIFFIEVSRWYRRRGNLRECFKSFSSSARSVSLNRRIKPHAMDALKGTKLTWFFKLNLQFPLSWWKMFQIHYYTSVSQFI